MANSLKPTNRHNECPVCADASGKCRSLEGSDLVLCMTEVGARTGEVINSYRCVTKNKSSQWGSFLPYDHVKESDREEYAKRRAQREAQRVQQQKAQQSKALSPADLNQNNQQLLAQLQLDPGDRANLLERGLSETDIAPFRSIKPWQRLTVPLTAGTPGVKGSKVQSPYEGYLCPVWDTDGHVLAFQIRNRNKGGDQPKYPWLSTNAAPSKLANNEQPLTYIPGAHSITVNLCEGVLKPYIASKKHGETFIGAAGGNFASSSQQLKKYLEYASPFEVVLCPDGGATDNPQVMGEYAKLADLVKSLGHDLKVRWYGQFEKSDGDIDEISAEQFEGSKLLIWAEFKAMAAPAKPRAAAPKLTATEGCSQDYGYMPNHGEVLFPAMKQARAVFIGADCGTGKSRLIEAYLDWLKANSDEEIPVVSFTHRTALGEALGEMLGVPFKTEINEFGDGLGQVLTLDSAHPKSAVRYHGDRTRSNTVFVLDEGDQGIDHMVHSGTSINRVRQEVIEQVCEAGQRSRQVILMSAGLTDRHVSLIQQSMGISVSETLTIANTHKRDMGAVWRCYSAAQVWFELTAAMERGEKCIVKLSGAEYESIFSTKTAEAWFQGKRILALDHDATHDPSNRKTYLEAETLVRGTNGSYACEVIHTSEGIKSRLTGQRIVSYISHPDPAIRAERQQHIFAQYDLVIFTNTISSGVSLEQGDFGSFFQIENGAGTVDDMMQSTARYRPTNIQRYIYVKPQVKPPHGNGATDPLKLQAGKDRNWSDQQGAIASAKAPWLPDNDLLVGGNLGQLWRGYCLHSEAERNQQASNYADEFFNLLTEANYQVRDAFIADWELLGDQGQKDFASTVKECRDASAATDDQETSDRDVEGADLKKLVQKRERTKTERQQITKLRAKERYGVEADEVTPEVIKAEKKGLYSRLENRYYLERGLEAAAERDAAKARKVTERGRTWREDVLKGSQAYKVRLQQQVGLDKFLAFLRTAGEDGRPVAVHQNSPEVAELVNQLAKHRDALADTFRVQVGKATTTFLDDGTTKVDIDISKPIKIVQTLLKRLELNLKTTGKTVRIDGEKTRLFSLVDLLDQPDGPLIDYERFAELREKSDRDLVADSQPAERLAAENEPTGNLVVATLETTVESEPQATGNLVAGNLVAII